MAFNTFLQYLFRFTKLKLDIPELLFISDVLDLLLPGLIFWYITSLFSGSEQRTRDYWYFIPASIALLVSSIYVLSIDNFSFPTFIGSPFHIALLFSIVLWKSYIIFKTHQTIKAASKVANAKQKEELRWPKVLTIFLGVSLYVALLLLIYHTVIHPFSTNVLHQQIREVVELNYIVFNSSIIFVTMFFALKYPKALSRSTITLVTDNMKEEDTLMLHYEKKLAQLVEKDSIHLDTELNEKMLAEKLQIQSYLLSKLLNYHIGKSFSVYINEKRVEHAKKILSKDMEKSLTNFAVAIDSGFRSESVFYVNFKKYAGMTPRQYRLKCIQMEEAV
ncbi:hypothetical protein GCM10023331_21920 [Algivirga pacifica]|uniref:HTH araC/xylS-type domain-containing protein n=2 Tax=Algivirga pacifica TaxID=1162670 RepID=A0ABP9D9R1_9BACT